MTRCRFGVIAVVFAAGCGEEAPVITSVDCSPAQLSIASPERPYRVRCMVKVDGKVGDVSSSATGSDGVLWSTDSPSTSANELTVTFSNAEAPPLGTLAIMVKVDHPHGIDGPGDDTATTAIEVVP